MNYYSPQSWTLIQPNLELLSTIIWSSYSPKCRILIHHNPRFLFTIIPDSYSPKSQTSIQHNLDINNFIEVWFLVASRGVEICVSSVFKKMTLAGLNSLRQKDYQISVKNRIFDDPFHKKGPVLVILVMGHFYLY